MGFNNDVASTPSVKYPKEKEHPKEPKHNLNGYELIREKVDNIKTNTPTPSKKASQPVKNKVSIGL